MSALHVGFPQPYVSTKGSTKEGCMSQQSLYQVEMYVSTKDNTKQRCVSEQSLYQAEMYV